MVGTYLYFTIYNGDKFIIREGFLDVGRVSRAVNVAIFRCQEVFNCFVVIYKQTLML